MANEITIHINADAREAEAAVKSLGKVFEEHRRQVGIAMTAAGAAIMGVAALSIKAAQEQAIGINVLDQALRRVGTSYDAEHDAIEASISALMRKTNYSDEAQRASLMRLVTLTGDYTSSLNALPVVLDLAAALHMDLETAALLVSKALQGNTALFARYGVVLKEGASATEIMATLTEKFGGSAQAAANPVIQLRNQLDELMEVIGDVLIPVLNTVLPNITEFARRIGDWAKEHPMLTQVIILTTVAIGGLMVVLGPLLLMLPGLVIAFTALAGALSLVGGPVGIGLFVAGVAAVTGAVLLMKKAVGEMGDALTVSQTATKEATETTKQLTSAYDEQMAAYDKLGEKLPWLAATMKAELHASMLESLNDVKELKDALRDFPVQPVADLTGHFMELNYAVEEAGKQFKQAENPLERMWALMEQLNLVTPTAFEDFTEKAGDLADRLHTDLATAMRMLAEQAIPVLEGQVQATVRSFLDMERETKALASATEGVTDVYLTLAYRLQAMGRPMEDLLVPAEKLATIMFGATYNTEQLAQALDILARIKLDQLDTELQGVVKSLLGIETAGRAAQKAMDFTQPAHVPLSVAQLQPGKAISPDIAAQIMALAQSQGRPEVAMAALGRISISGMDEEAIFKLLQSWLITQQAQGIVAQQALDAQLQAEVERLKKGAIPFAEGGIVDSPTLAILGEHGREAVVPLVGYSREIANMASIMPDIPRMAAGGIVRQPTLALVGERGPEAIVPLTKDNNERVAQIFRSVPDMVIPSLVAGISERADMRAMGLPVVTTGGVTEKPIIQPLQDAFARSTTMITPSAQIIRMASAVHIPEMPSMAEGGMTSEIIKQSRLVETHDNTVVAPLKNLMAATSIVNMPDIPHMAEGGIVRQPTLALIGERGAEAIVPLNNKQARSDITFNFYGPVFGDEERIAQIFRDLARRGGFAGVME